MFSLLLHFSGISRQLYATMATPEISFGYIHPSNIPCDLFHTTMNQHTSKKNGSFKLPFSFDPDLLNLDLKKCLGYEFQSHYVPTNYSGENYILPLRSVGGSMKHVMATPEVADQYEDTEALKECGYFQEVINTFKCKKEAIRIMNMTPGEEMKVHTDFNCGYEDGIFRTHIPIKTNDQVIFQLDGKLVKMLPGETWYINANLPHGVKNDGSTDRVHLVLDCIRNEWSDELFRSAGYDFEEEINARKPVYSKDTLERMIEELSRQDTEGSKALVDDLKKQLATYPS